MAASTDNHIQLDHDVQVLIRGMNVPVFVDSTLADDKWVGGQWVYYNSNTFGRQQNVRVVGKSDGTLVSGFLLRPSERFPIDGHVTEYNFSSYQPAKTQLATMMIDGSYIFKYYEKFAFPNRDSGVNLTYSLSDIVYVSERGLITTLADATAAGIATPILAGYVWLVPSADNDYRIGIDRF